MEKAWYQAVDIICYHMCKRKNKKCIFAFIYTHTRVCVYLSLHICTYMQQRVRMRKRVFLEGYKINDNSGCFKEGKLNSKLLTIVSLNIKLYECTAY